MATTFRALMLGLGCVVLCSGAGPERFPIPETVAQDAKLIEVYRDIRYLEGPTWDPRSKALYFTAFDNDNEQILKFVPPRKVTVWMARTQGINGTYRSLDGRLLGAQSFGHRIISFGIGEEGPTELKVLYENQGLNQPKDLCQAPNGDIYFTDPDVKGEDHRKTSAVYRLATDGKATKVITDLVLPTGIVTSLDGKTLYVGDGALKLWKSYPINPDGSVGLGRLFFNPKTQNMADPGGMTIDEQGNLYLVGRGGVWVVTPEGRSLGLIAVPEFCSSVGFGGDDGRTLYVTSRKRVFSLSMKVRGGHLVQAP